MYGFLAALQILTRLPSPVPREVRSRDIAVALVWFPVVGALLGMTLLAFDALARLVFDHRVTAALLLALLVVVTGAFHLDGLIDAVDGLTGGPDADRRLEAMREAVAGPFGAIAACVLLLADFVALAALPENVRSQALVCMPLCGRTAVLAAYRLYPYGRHEPTLSAQLKSGASTPATLLGVSFAGAACFAVGGPGGLTLLALSLALMHAMALVTLGRLPGLTGDVYGAICEVSQLACLLAAPFALGR